MWRVCGLVLFDLKLLDPDPLNLLFGTLVLVNLNADGLCGGWRFLVGPALTGGSLMVLFPLGWNVLLMVLLRL